MRNKIYHILETLSSYFRNLIKGQAHNVNINSFSGYPKSFQKVCTKG